MGLSKWLAWCEHIVSGRGCIDDKVLLYQFGAFPARYFYCHSREVGREGCKWQSHHQGILQLLLSVNQLPNSYKMNTTGLAY